MKHLLMVYFMILTFYGYTQNTHEIQAGEKYLLDIITKDTLSSTTIYFPDDLDFGIEWKGHSHLILAKEKHRNYILLAGTHRVYQITEGNSSNPVVRIDSSDFYGDNYNCMAFVHRDTLFEYGGYGFWKNRDFFTRFIPASGDWEFVQGGDPLENSTVFSYLDKNANKFYCLGSYQQNSFKNFTPRFTDSVYEYDLNTKRWHILGKINAENFKNYHEEIKGNSWATPYGLGISLPNNFCILDFGANKIIPLKKSVWDSINALRANTTSRNQNPKSLWAYLNDTLYHFSINNAGFIANKIKFDKSSLDFSTAVPLFKPIKDSQSFFSITAYPQRNFSFWLIIAILALIFTFKFKNKNHQNPHHKNQPEVIPEIVNNQTANSIAFLNQLSPIERNILKELVLYSLQEKKMNILVINKILGVSAKDPEIQKARRSAIITNINNLYTQNTHSTGALISRERDEFDKRAWLYFIEEDKATMLSPNL